MMILVEILVEILMVISKDHYDLNSMSIIYGFVLKEFKISQQLVRFVLNWCERGKGFRPDWATKVVYFEKTLHFARKKSK